MTAEQLNEYIERTLKQNQAAIRQANSRVERLNRDAKRSTAATDRALKRLRESAANS